MTEIKGSEQRAVRSGVFPTIARPKPPSEKHTRTGVVDGSGVFFFAEECSRPFRPLPGCAAKSAHKWDVAIFSRESATVAAVCD